MPKQVVLPYSRTDAAFMDEENHHVVWENWLGEETNNRVFLTGPIIVRGPPHDAEGASEICCALVAGQRH